MRLADLAEDLFPLCQWRQRRRGSGRNPGPRAVFPLPQPAEQAQSQLYQNESKLRYMMGITPTDGRMIRPADDPTTAKISFDWSQVQTEAMARSVEIREARWRVKQREMELIAAKNYLLPRVDLDGRYRWLGLGDEFIDAATAVLAAGRSTTWGAANSRTGTSASWPEYRSDSASRRMAS